MKSRRSEISGPPHGRGGSPGGWSGEDGCCGAGQGTSVVDGAPPGDLRLLDVLSIHCARSSQRPSKNQHPLSGRSLHLYVGVWHSRSKLESCSFLDCLGGVIRRGSDVGVLVRWNGLEPVPRNGDADALALSDPFPLRHLQLQLRVDGVGLVGKVDAPWLLSLEVCYPIHSACSLLDDVLVGPNHRCHAGVPTHLLLRLYLTVLHEGCWKLLFHYKARS
mmetsp:Transcript_2805/g.9449  ORF Transcript_2805/g.9449 Transcript_2805/m.9449 type:complete len:219 (+) Transcript_2805:6508-7164(+)